MLQGKCVGARRMEPCQRQTDIGAAPFCVGASPCVTSPCKLMAPFPFGRRAHVCACEKNAPDCPKAATTRLHLRRV
eukprot:2254468-Amphidinium_carterae.1